MKKTLVILTLSILFACKNDVPKTHYLKHGFITEQGEYILSKDKMVIVKRLENESLIFAIANRKRKILYQQSLVETFSENHYWLLYADDKQNIYYYNSDYSSQQALLFDAEKKEYNAFDFCTFEINLPIEFKKKLKDNNLGNCISIK